MPTITISVNFTSLVSAYPNKSNTITDPNTYFTYSSDSSNVTVAGATITIPAGTTVDWVVVDTSSYLNFAPSINSVTDSTAFTTTGTKLTDGKLEDTTVSQNQSSSACTISFTNAGNTYTWDPKIIVDS